MTGRIGSWHLVDNAANFRRAIISSAPGRQRLIGRERGGADIRIRDCPRDWFNKQFATEPQVVFMCNSVEVIQCLSLIAQGYFRFYRVIDFISVAAGIKSHLRDDFSGVSAVVSVLTD